MAKLSALKTMLAEARYNGVDAIPIPHVQRDSEGHVLTMFNSRHITSFVEIQVWDFLYWSFFGAPPYMATSNSAGRKKKQKNHVPTEAIAWVMGVEVHTEVTLVLSSHEPPSHIEAYAGAKAFCLEISD